MIAGISPLASNFSPSSCAFIRHFSTAAPPLSMPHGSVAAWASRIRTRKLYDRTYIVRFSRQEEGIQPMRGCRIIGAAIRIAVISVIATPAGVALAAQRREVVPFDGDWKF